MPSQVERTCIIHRVQKTTDITKGCMTSQVERTSTPNAKKQHTSPKVVCHLKLNALVYSIHQVQKTTDITNFTKGCMPSQVERTSIHPSGNVPSS